MVDWSKPLFTKSGLAGRYLGKLRCDGPPTAHFFPHVVAIYSDGAEEPHTYAEDGRWSHESGHGMDLFNHPPAKPKTLDELFEIAKKWWDNATPEERERMLEEQKKSWVRAEMKMRD